MNSNMPVPEILYLNESLLTLCDLTISSGMNFDEIKYNEDMRYLFLGSKFEDEIELGQVFADGDLQFVVAVSTIASVVTINLYSPVGLMGEKQ